MIFKSGFRKSLYVPALSINFENSIYETSDPDVACQLSKYIEVTYDKNELEALLNPPESIAVQEVKTVEVKEEAKKGGKKHGYRKVSTD